MERDWLYVAETWRSIPGFPAYEASTNGRVRRVTAASGATVGAVLKPALDSQGYEQVHLREDGKTHPRKVHVLVAASFIGPRPPGLEVSHQNGRRRDNRPANLAYETRLQNEHRKIEHGTSNRGVRNGNATMTEALAGLIKSDLGRGIVVREIALQRGVSQSVVFHIRAGNSWSHLVEAA